jgi:hypothetical protein
MYVYMYKHTHLRKPAAPQPLPSCGRLAPADGRAAANDCREAPVFCTALETHSVPRHDAARWERSSGGVETNGGRMQAWHDEPFIPVLPASATQCPC